MPFLAYYINTMLSAGAIALLFFLLSTASANALHVVDSHTGIYRTPPSGFCGVVPSELPSLLAISDAKK